MLMDCHILILINRDLTETLELQQHTYIIIHYIAGPGMLPITADIIVGVVVPPTLPWAWN